MQSRALSTMHFCLSSKLGYGRDASNLIAGKHYKQNTTPYKSGASAKCAGCWSTRENSIQYNSRSNVGEHGILVHVMSRSIADGCPRPAHSVKRRCLALTLTSDRALDFCLRCLRRYSSNTSTKTAPISTLFLNNIFDIFLDYKKLGKSIYN